MKIYQVGGSVRDALMGREAKDRDYVVVGATVEDMLAQGFQPVGKDFPVFLHPKTHEEYALARTERKSGKGYKGFVVHASPEVTLEQDLQRRDLTINAMALDEAGNVVDPYGGQADLANTMFRHVSPAFAEDPLRVLRLARFAARFTEFSVAPETLALCRQLVEAGEMQALVAERVWVELAKGLQSKQPSRMFEVLADCGALAALAPVLADANGRLDAAIACAIDQTAANGWSLPMHYAALCGHLLPEQVESLSAQWRVPLDCSGLATLVARERDALANVLTLEAENLHDLLLRADALRRPERAEAAAAISAVLARCMGTTAQSAEPSTVSARVTAVLAAMRTVDAGAIARSSKPADIPEALRAARIKVLSR